MPKTEHTPSNSKSGTQIVACTHNCASTFQDKLYGSGRRVHNIKKSGELRCTVCGKDRKD